MRRSCNLMGCVMALMVMLSATTVARAALVTVPNAGFELTRSNGTLFTLTDLQFIRLNGTANTSAPALPVGPSYTLDNWTLLSGTSANAAVQNNTNAQFAGSTGVNNNALHLGNAGLHTVGNTLAATLEAGTLYTLSVDVGVRTDFAANLRGYELALFAGATEVGRIKSTDPGAVVTPIGSLSTISLLVDSSNFSGLVGQPLQIRLASNVNNALTGQTVFDNVKLDATFVGQNFSFEVPATASSTTTGPTGWTDQGSDIRSITLSETVTGVPQTPFGTQWLALDAQPLPGAVYQKIGTITPGQQYDVSMLVAQRTDMPLPSTFVFGLYAGIGAPTQALAILTQADLALLAGVPQTATVSYVSSLGDLFAGQELFIRMAATTPSTGPAQILFDGVQLTVGAAKIIPEPATIGLLAIAGLCLARRRNGSRAEPDLR